MDQVHYGEVYRGDIPGPKRGARRSMGPRSMFCPHRITCTWRTRWFDKVTVWCCTHSLGNSIDVITILKGLNSLLYSRTSEKQPPWGQKKVAVMGRKASKFSFQGVQTVYCDDYPIIKKTF